MKTRHSLVLGVTAVASIVFTSTAARAQSLRPHILFIFDTSISMRENTSGTQVAEGTNICPLPVTNPATPPSRLQGLKNGIRAAVVSWRKGRAGAEVGP